MTNEQALAVAQLARDYRTKGIKIAYDALGGIEVEIEAGQSIFLHHIDEGKVR